MYLYVHKRSVQIKFIPFQSASNRLKLELKSLISAKSSSLALQFTFKKFYIKFRFEFYSKIKHIEIKIIYLLDIFSKLIVLHLKVFKFHLFFACRVAMTNT